MKGCKIAFTLALINFGCFHSRMDTGDLTHTGKPNTIRIGMVFERANAMLKEHGAEPTRYAVQLSHESRDRGLDLHFYQLRSGAVMGIISKPATTGRVIDSISISTSKPKSWDSKNDPERDKFFESFKNFDEYKL